ncbi:MAG: NTP transferase domain-containing protein [Bacteroidaceae bacterium]|nr:NTP transferase domain-containing protein [Bacteroidaceae bacterium]
MKALIFAAGLGTRLRPLTNDRPKALVEVHGKLLLAHVIEKLRKAGYTEVVINVHHFGEQIIDYIAKHPVEGMKFIISDERTELLDTGGGIRQAGGLFTQDGRPFLIHNVDIFSNLDLKEFYTTHPTTEGATLLVSERKTSRYLLFDPKDNRLVGWTNIQTGEVKSPYPNLRVEDCRMYAFAGIHLFSQSLLQWMKDWPTRFSIIDFYLSVADRVPIIGVPKADLQLIDVGKPEALATISRDFIP